MRTAGSGSGVVMPGVSQPALPHDDPAATPSRSMTVTSTPRSWRNQAVDEPDHAGADDGDAVGGVVR